MYIYETIGNKDAFSTELLVIKIRGAGRSIIGGGQYSYIRVHKR